MGAEGDSALIIYKKFIRFQNKNMLYYYHQTVLSESESILRYTIRTGRSPDFLNREKITKNIV